MSKIKHVKLAPNKEEAAKIWKENPGRASVGLPVTMMAELLINTYIDVVNKKKEEDRK